MSILTDFTNSSYRVTIAPAGKKDTLWINIPTKSGDDYHFKNENIGIEFDTVKKTRRFFKSKENKPDESKIKITVFDNKHNIKEIIVTKTNYNKIIDKINDAYQLENLNKTLNRV